MRLVLMRKTSQETIVQAVADWRHRGLIDGECQERLTKRYDSPDSLGRILLQWLGLCAIFLIGLGILSLIGMMSGSLGLGAVLLGVAAGTSWYFGTRMCTDPLRRYSVSGAVVVTVSLILAMSAMSVLAVLATDSGEPPIALILFATATISLVTAYIYRLRWPLLFGLLCFFHAVGSSHFYGGSGSYFFDIQDPRLMALIAAMAALFGVWHQAQEENTLTQWSGFGRLFVIFGLLYFNCSLWFLSLRDGWGDDGSLLPWVVAFTLAAILEIIIGARLADTKFTGFGVVFLSIDLYTRFYENFWDALSSGLFFLIAGVIALGLGFTFEVLDKKAWRETGIL
jgi:hypothetical protein